MGWKNGPATELEVLVLFLCRVAFIASGPINTCGLRLSGQTNATDCLVDLLFEFGEPERWHAHDAGVTNRSVLVRTDPPGGS